jgi:ferric-dicitrate binding protein FerR (iron transport regulator)
MSEDVERLSRYRAGELSSDEATASRQMTP